MLCDISEIQLMHMHACTIWILQTISAYLLQRVSHVLRAKITYWAIASHLYKNHSFLDKAQTVLCCCFAFFWQINVAQRRFTQRSESGLVAAVILLRFVVPLLSDKTLMDVLEVRNLAPIDQCFMLLLSSSPLLSLSSSSSSSSSYTADSSVSTSLI